MNIELVHIKAIDPIDPNLCPKKRTIKKELNEIEKSNQLKKLCKKNRSIIFF